MNHQDLIIVPMLNHRQLGPNRSNYDYALDLEHFQQEQLVVQYYLLVRHQHHRRHHHCRHLHHLRHQHRHLLHVQLPVLRRKINQNNTFKE